MAAVSKNIYFNVLDDIVDKYNNTVHRTIKVKPIDVTYDENSNAAKPKIKVGDHVRFQNTQTFLLKDIPKIGQKTFCC